MNWQPIETAPQDGNPLLLWVDIDDGGELMILYRDSGGRWLYDGDVISYRPLHLKPTHWMPLPEPPSSASPALVAALAADDGQFNPLAHEQMR